MKKKGKVMYVPRITIVDLEDIMREENIPDKSTAWRKMVEHARVGREAERIMKLDWRKKMRLPPLDKSKKGKKGRGIWL